MTVLRRARKCLLALALVLLHAWPARAGHPDGMTSATGFIPLWVLAALAVLALGLGVWAMLAPKGAPPKEPERDPPPESARLP